MKYFLIISIFLIIFQTDIQSQALCATELTSTDSEIILEFTHELDERGASVRNGEIVIPVAIHVVSNDQGLGGLDNSEVLEELKDLNIKFEGAGIFFQPCTEINKIDNSRYSQFDQYIDEELCDNQDIENVVNIYFVPRLLKSGASTINSELCGYTYYTNVNKNRIILSNSCAINGNTLAHEMGHYLSLLHTHDYTHGRELVDGSNCNSTGDGICDTPADPQLSKENVDEDCRYFGEEQDLEGNRYESDPSNIMSYAPKKCRIGFTSQQNERLREYVINYRNYLKCDYVSTNVIDLKEKFKYRVYPVPASQVINFKFEKRPELVEIYNMNGRRIMYQFNPSSVSAYDMSDWSSGLYFYQISYNKERSSGKFLKQ